MSKNKGTNNKTVANNQTGGLFSPVKIVVSSQREIHVQRSQYKGQDNLDIRTYVVSDDYTGYTPKGVSIPWEDAVGEKALGKKVADAILKVCTLKVEKGAQ